MKTTAAINVAWKARGLDEDTARDLYERVTGKRRLTLMNGSEQQAVLVAINATPVAPRAKGLTGPYAKKLQALWIAGWNLGVVRDRTDGAMLAFIKRQTGIEHTAFLRDAADARKAVEALKAWLGRAADVEWKAHQHPADCILSAQLRLIAAARTDGPPHAAYVEVRMSSAAKHVAMNAMGEMIRAKAGA